MGGQRRPSSAAFALGLAGIALAQSAPSAAQIAGLLGLKTRGVLAADYKTGDQLRVVSAEDGDDNPYPTGLARAIEMVEAKGFGRFGLIRTKCETTSLRQLGQKKGGRPLISTCVLWEGETAEPKGKDDQVAYFRIDHDNGSKAVAEK